MQTKTKYKVAFHCTYKVETVKFISAGISGVCVCAGGYYTLSVGCMRMALGVPLGSLCCSEEEEVNQ